MGVVIFGNDYFLCFNKNNKFIECKVFYKNIIFIEYGFEGEDEEVFVIMYLYIEEIGVFIIVIDICILMFYVEYVGWLCY